jgi:hypothetical protein
LRPSTISSASMAKSRLPDCWQHGTTNCQQRAFRALLALHGLLDALDLMHDLIPDMGSLDRWSASPLAASGGFEQ